MSMNCPKCQSNEIDSGGFCLVCGTRAYVSEDLPQTEAAGRLPPITLDTADTVPQAELPEWRQELSRRLQEIKWKREVGEVHPEGAEAAARPEATTMPQPSSGGPGFETPRPAGARRSRRSLRSLDRDLSQIAPPAPAPDEPFPSRNDPAVPEPQVADRELFAARPPAPQAPETSPFPHNAQADLEPQIDQDLPPAHPAGDIVIRPSVEHVEASRQQYTQELIDTVVAKLAAREHISAPELEPKLGTRPEPVSVAKKEVKPERTPAPLPGPAREAEPERPSGPIRESKVAHRLERSTVPRPEPRSEADAERKAGTMLVPDPAPKREVLPGVEHPLFPEAGRDVGVNLPPLGELHDDKLILLSRTLAGLVDLIIIILCAGLMVVAVDILEGIEVFDTISKVHYGLLFLVMYFVYSVFFLGTAAQTIGMMLTDLHLTGASIRRPAVSQILVRCCAFLLSLAFAGLGLLWGLFDRQARCLHDLLSRTRVVRSALD